MQINFKAIILTCCFLTYLFIKTASGQCNLYLGGNDTITCGEQVKFKVTTDWIQVSLPTTNHLNGDY